jgi:hypothetical protein
LTISETSLNSPIAEVALALAIHKDGLYRPFGTCVVIASGLALTARHVFENAWRTFEKKQLLPQDDPLIRGSEAMFNEVELLGSFNIFALKFFNAGKSACIFQVNKISYLPDFDIALLKLNSYMGEAPAEGKNVALDISPPNKGEKVAAFGYHGYNIAIEERVQMNNEAPAVLEVEWAPKAGTTHGTIIDVFNTRDDVPRIGPKRVPCYTTTMQIEDGMSGGPVFSQEGKLRGLISSKWSFDDGAQTSLVVTLWPAMAIKIGTMNLHIKDFPNVQPEYLMDLAKMGVITAPDWARVARGARSLSYNFAAD